MSFEGGKASRRPFFTEFCVYQTNKEQPKDDRSFAFLMDPDDDDESELCYSLSARVYDSRGQLKQGASGFFTLRSFASIEKSS